MYSFKSIKWRSTTRKDKAITSVFQNRKRARNQQTSCIDYIRMDLTLKFRTAWQTWEISDKKLNNKCIVRDLLEWRIHPNILDISSLEYSQACSGECVDSIIYVLPRWKKEMHIWWSIRSVLNKNRTNKTRLYPIIDKRFSQ